MQKFPPAFSILLFYSLHMTSCYNIWMTDWYYGYHKKSWKPSITLQPRSKENWEKGHHSLVEAFVSKSEENPKIMPPALPSCQ